MSFQVYNMKTFLEYPEFIFKWACFEPFIWSGNRHRHQPTKLFRIKQLAYIFNTIMVMMHICAVIASAFVPRVTAEAEAYSHSDSKVFEVLAIISYFGCSMYKMLHIFWRRDDIGRVLEELKELFPSAAKQKRLAELNESKKGQIGSGGNYRFGYYDEKSRITMQRLQRFFMFAYVSYNTIPIMKLCFTVLTYQEHITYKAQVNAWYPWHNHNNHSSFVGFVITYLAEAAAEYASTVFVMSGEFLFCFFTTQMLMHYNYLCSALGALDASAPDAVLQLKALISYHNHLMRLSRLINSIYNITFALDLIITTFAISLMGLAIVLVNFADAVMFSAGFSFFLLFGYIFCKNGEELISETQKINSAIFYSNWYEGSPEYRRLITFFIMRTKSPCQYQAYGYMSLSMATYMRILKLSYQIFTSFRAVE